MKNLIRQARQLRGLTQAELAQRVGTTAATISRLEKDTMTVSVGWLNKLAAALEVHPVDFLERPERPGVMLVGRAGRSGRVAIESESEILVELPTADAVAIEISSAQGPYAAGERLIGERLRGASMISGVGKDCIVALKNGALLLARLVGNGPKFTLVPPEPGSPILYEEQPEWVAPVAMRLQRVM